MAIRFEKVFGVRTDTMMRMQAAHDLAEVRAREAEIWWSEWPRDRPDQSNVSGVDRGIQAA